MASSGGSVSQQISKADRLLKKGARDEAAALYQSVLDRFPKNPKALKGLKSCQSGGVTQGTVQDLIALLNQGRLTEGDALAKALLHKTPEDATAHAVHGAILGQMGRTSMAVNALRKAVALRPDYADGHANLGKALADQGDPEAGTKSLQTAIKLNPKHTMAHTNLGAALMKTGDFDGAVAAYRKQLDITPGQYDAHMGIALALKDAGRTQEAIAEAEAALLLEPDHCVGHRNLSTIKKYKEGDPHLAQMQQLYKTADPQSEGHMHLSFGLAKAYEDTGQIDLAFQALQTGNRLRKTIYGYQAKSDSDVSLLLRRIFNEGALPSVTAPDDPQLIFILGMPRSGTTLVEQILASHSQVTGGGELTFLHDSVWPLLRDAGPDPDFQFTSDHINQIRDNYLGRLRQRFGDVDVITDKAPMNFRYIGFIKAAFPNARIIHTMRDPMAIGWSIYKTYFVASGMHYGSDFDDIISYMKDYRRLMAGWHRLYPGQIHDQSYERLTEDQDAQTRQLVQAVGLDWDPACLDFHKNARVVRTASRGQVSQAMYQGSSKAWKKFAAHLGPLKAGLDQLG